MMQDRQFLSTKLSYEGAHELSNKLIDFTSVTMNGHSHHATISEEEYLKIEIQM